MPRLLGFSARAFTHYDQTAMRSLTIAVAGTGAGSIGKNRKQLTLDYSNAVKCVINQCPEDRVRKGQDQKQHGAASASPQRLATYLFRCGFRSAILQNWLRDITPMFRLTFWFTREEAEMTRSHMKKPTHGQKS